MRRALPPLHALRAFEAVGRHMSFSRAAEELCVSTAAISRQVRSLEAFLGRPLFERLTRQIRFTDLGSAYFARISEAMALAEEATREAMSAQRSRLLVATMPTTANLCLMPWLAGFTDETQIEVEVVSSMTPPNLVAGEADVAIRVGARPGEQASPGTIGRIPHPLVADWTGVTAEPLWDEIFIPVCSRRFLLDNPQFAFPEAGGGRHLIHIVSRPDAWGDWLAAQGRSRHLTERGLEVGHSYVALQAARRHRGIALVATVHFHALEWAHEMACPWSGSLRSKGAFYLLHRTADRSDPRISAFLDWIRRQGDDSVPDR